MYSLHRLLVKETCSHCRQHVTVVNMSLSSTCHCRQHVTVVNMSLMCFSHREELERVGVSQRGKSVPVHCSLFLPLHPRVQVRMTQAHIHIRSYIHTHMHASIHIFTYTSTYVTRTHVLSFPEKTRWCSIKQACQGSKV